LEGNASGSVEIYNFQKGEKIGSYSPPQGIPSPVLAIDEKGETLYLSIAMATDEIIGTLDLTSFQ
jgi:hypothetical protein